MNFKAEQWFEIKMNQKNTVESSYGFLIELN